MHYDHITFHEPEYPTAAAKHMGHYFAWAVSQNLHSPEAEALPDFARLQNGSLSGTAFVLDRLGGGIDTTCFNELGNRFTQYYYFDEDEGYGRFMSDYFQAMGIETEAAFYRLPHAPEHQQRLNAVFQTAFEEWLESLNRF